MQTTNLRLLRADFRAQIRGLSPSYPYHQTSWAPVDRLDHVPGERIRTFFIAFESPSPVEDGIYGDGVEYELEMSVYTNYAHLNDDIVDEMLAQDAEDLWLALEARIDPILAGFVSIRPEGFTSEDDDEGGLWGAHVFTIRYLGLGG